VADWIVDLIRSWGVAGVALLMLLENILPPIPSELIMPLAGYHARAGRMNLVAVIAAGSIGSLVGTTGWYWLGRKWGPERVSRFVERHGHWLTISPAELARSRKWLNERGRWALFVGRLVPGLRTLISLPAGAAAVPLPTFLILSGAGTLLWTAILAGAGMMLGSRHDDVGQLLGPVSWVVTVAILGTYLWRLVPRLRTRRKSGRITSGSTAIE
jgi:membrane protein DedA with SNARE-associated domain